MKSHIVIKSYFKLSKELWIYQYETKISKLSLFLRKKHTQCLYIPNKLERNMAFNDSGFWNCSLTCYPYNANDHFCVMISCIYLYIIFNDGSCPKYTSGIRNTNNMIGTPQNNSFFIIPSHYINFCFIVLIVVVMKHITTQTKDSNSLPLNYTEFPNITFALAEWL